MEAVGFELLLLRAAFACMTCDRAIDAAEVAHLRELCEERRLFGDIDLGSCLAELEKDLHRQGFDFFQEFLADLAAADLDAKQELILLETAVDMVESNSEVAYAEIKFVKLIRAELGLSDDRILQEHPKYGQYLKPDVVVPERGAVFPSGFFTGESFPILKLPKDSH